MLGALFSSVAVVVTAPSLPEDGGDEPNVATEQQDEQARQALDDVLASCRKALGASECTFAGEADSPWRANVVFYGDSAQVTLKGPNRVIVRTLEFLPNDGEKQRRVAAGLLVAAMTAAARLSERKAEPEPVNPPQTAEEVISKQPDAEGNSGREVPPESEQKGATEVVSIEGAFLAGPTLGADQWGIGGRLAIGGRLGGRWGVVGGVDARHSSHELWEATSAQVAAGPWFSLFPQGTFLDVRMSLEAVFEALAVQRRPLGTGPQTAFRAGARTRAEMTLGRGNLTPLVGLGVTALSPELDLRLDGDSALVVPALVGMGYFGIRYKFMK